ncbi:MAG: winged helix-turn-helix transcriptional regulator, partial [Lawsonibacter sp.]|nr:winged helix-turn-helix transcriptional regulator [Lawsonibacter sp.]
EDGFLHREVFGEVPPRVEYTLTPLGESFAPLLHAMLEWSRENLTKETENF